MASNTKETMQKRKWKKKNSGAARKREIRINGSTPSLDAILGPLVVASTEK